MYVQQLFRVIIEAMNDVDGDVIISAWSSLDALVKHLDPSEQLQHLPSLKQAIKFVQSDIRNGELPGFCILKKVRNLLNEFLSQGICSVVLIRMLPIYLLKQSFDMFSFDVPNHYYQ